MELDELKKSWNTWNEKLPQEPLTSKEQITELLANYKKKSGKSLRDLIGFQRISLYIGGLTILVCIVIGCIISMKIPNDELRNRILVMLAFMAATLLGGVWWDHKTYRWTRDTRVDEMSVTEVSRRIVKLRLWTRCEIWVLGIWAILFALVYNWTIGIFENDLPAILSVIGIQLAISAVLIYFVYKRFMYKHLDNIKQNIEELEDICTE